MENYLFEQNIHWTGKKYDAGLERDILNHIFDLVELDQIIAISGIRRCGKSFLLKQIINNLLRTGVRQENILFVNLELPGFSNQSAHILLDQVVNTYRKMKSPEGRLYIFLDEIQMLREWEKWLKYQYDLHKEEIKFFITGSNSQLLSAEFATLFSGRIIEKKLLPFSFGEILRFKKINYTSPQDRVLNKPEIMSEFDAYLKYGGMPETLNVQDISIRLELLSSYFNAIIYRDIVPRFSVRDGNMLHDLAVYLLNHIADSLNLRKISDYFNSSRQTIRDFISFLSAVYLLDTIPKFSYSSKRRQLSLKKCYSIDNGFANLIPLRFSADKGKLLENLVFIELIRRGEIPFYWNDGAECDFISANKNGTKTGIQVCYEIIPENIEREVKGLVVAKREAGCEAFLILTYDERKTLESEIGAVEVRPVFDWILGA